MSVCQITMWDLANGKLLRTITDAHPPGTAILHVKVNTFILVTLLIKSERKHDRALVSVFLFQFTDLPTLAVCNDSGGSVFELTFRSEIPNFSPSDLLSSHARLENLSLGVTSGILMGRCASIHSLCTFTDFSIIAQRENMISNLSCATDWLCAI